MLAYHIIVCKALSSCSNSLKPETTLPDGYDYPQFVDEEMEVQRGDLPNRVLELVADSDFLT